MRDRWRALHPQKDDFEPMIIKTRRAILRPFTMDDCSTLWRITNEPDMMQYFPNPNPPTADRIERIITHQLAHWQAHGYGWWAMTTHTSNELIGWCGLQYLPETDETEVGYLLARSYWGRGITTEAAIASLDFGFGEHNMDAIIGITHPDNIASQRVLLKSGLSPTGPAHYFGMDCQRYIAEQSTWVSPATP
jgi:ribosomal-protein-alanine N-acetyltransferase